MFCRRFTLPLTLPARNSLNVAGYISRALGSNLYPSATFFHVRDNNCSLTLRQLTTFDQNTQRTRAVQSFTWPRNVDVSTERCWTLQLVLLRSVSRSITKLCSLPNSLTSLIKTKYLFFSLLNGQGQKTITISLQKYACVRDGNKMIKN